jgi:hypothetical protein
MKMTDEPPRKYPSWEPPHAHIPVSLLSKVKGVKVKEPNDVLDATHDVQVTFSSEADARHFHGLLKAAKGKTP